MNDFLRKLFSRISSLWGGWSMVQRVILVGIVIAAVVGVGALFRVSSTPTLVPVLGSPITDEEALFKITTRIEQENVAVKVAANGVVQVADAVTARRMRAIIMSEGLVPTGMDPWAIFDRDRWTITDFERKINVRRAITQEITNHIKALDDVDNAVVEIAKPEKALFRSEQNPVSVSVTIFPKPGSDITQNRKKIEGIQRILKNSGLEGLQDENITITDQKGIVLNDFEGMAQLDRLNLIKNEQKHVKTQEDIYSGLVLTALQGTFSPDRVRFANIKIDMDMSKKSIETKELLPTIIKPQTPGLAYDDSIRVQSIQLSESTSDTLWKGTGYNPEGPAGVEGQTPPAFKDMSNLYGEMNQKTRVHNEEISQRSTQEERSPQIDRITVAVNIDGTWKWKYDEKKNPVIASDGSIEREYTPVPPEELRSAQALIRDAVGYNSARGDSVTVQNIPFDRSSQFKEEDAAYFRQKQIQLTVIIFLSGLTFLLIAFIIFRMIQREVERRRRLAEEERARREQMLRESAMAEAEQEGVDVSISVEERTRMELMESIINMAKEHPEDCAQLIRTWILED